MDEIAAEPYTGTDFAKDVTAEIAKGVAITVGGYAATFVLAVGVGFVVQKVQERKARKANLTVVED